MPFVTTGPTHWGQVNAQCNGLYQSPIDIQTNTLIDNYRYGSLENSYSPDRNLNFTNNGHTLIVSNMDGKQFHDDVIWANELLGNYYRLDHIEMHWGLAGTAVCTSNSLGSSVSVCL
jgi:carbonic anhydrase